MTLIIRCILTSEILKCENNVQPRIHEIYYYKENEYVH